MHLYFSNLNFFPYDEQTKFVNRDKYDNLAKNLLLLSLDIKFVIV